MLAKYDLGKSILRDYILCAIYFIARLFFSAIYFNNNHVTSSFLISGGYISLSWKMSGIENINGGKHCYANACLQSLSVNVQLLTALRAHNADETSKLSKYNPLKCISSNCNI